MKIGFDISQTGQNKAGCGYFADSLILALSDIDRFNEYILYPYFGSSFWDSNGLKNTRRIDAANFSTKIVAETQRECFTFFENFPPDAEKKLGDPDLIHANNYSCPADLSTAKIVYTLYDMSVIEHPEFTTEQNRWSCFNGIFNAANNADFILSISDYSMKKFLDIFPHYPTERISVVYPGNRFNFNQDSNTGGDCFLNGLEQDKFWLAVGTIEPRKNLRRLLNAYAVYVKKSADPLSLVLAGGRGWLEDDLEQFVAKLGISQKVKFLGYVSDDELNWLYRNCFGFIYPSLYEGFGLPVLEAMSRGAASIVSNVTSIPEVAGDAAHYVDPFKEPEIANAICLLAENSDHRKRLKHLALKQAQKFSWKRCASEVLEIYNQVFNSSKR